MDEHIEVDPQSAVELAFGPDRVVVQYRPQFDADGASWDEALVRLGVLYRSLPAPVWDQLEEPVMVSADGETEWFVMELDGCQQWSFVGQLRTMNLSERVTQYLGGFRTAGASRS